MNKVLFFVFAMLMMSCQPSLKETKVQVNFENAKADEELTIKGMGFDSTFTLNNGKIDANIPVTEAGNYAFYLNRFRTNLIINPGDVVNISGDISNLENTITVSDAHKVSRDFFKAKNEILNKELSFRKLISLAPQNFLDSLDKGMSSLESFVTASELPSMFKDKEKEALKYIKSKYLVVYPTYSDSDIDTLPQAFKDATKGIDLADNKKFLSSADYASLVNYDFKMKLYADQETPYEEVVMREIGQLPAGDIRNELLLQEMTYILGPNEDMDKVYTFFKANNTNSSHLAKIKKQYDELQVLKKGSDSPQFEYENYKGGKTSLKDLAGKYVYIDVWATWCGPCKAEIPALKEMEEKYAGDKLEFVSISIDKKDAYETWRKMVADKELGGVQLFADNDWSSQFVKDYMIKGIPRFIMVDPQGKIYTADAPRPSDDRFEKLMTTLDI